MKILRNLATIILFFLVACITGCSNSDSPDVSGIPVNIELERFDQFLFEKLDTSAPVQAFGQLQSAYPHFADDFIVNILGLPPVTAAVYDSSTQFTFSELKRFIRLTRPVYNSLSRNTGQMQGVEKELVRGFKYVKYYYPAYKVPHIIAYVGPFNAPGVAVTSNSIAIGLQLFGGKDFAYYTSPEAQELFPRYISRTFEPAYIPANCMKAVAEDLNPDDSRGRPLIEQMIEKGKQWYLARRFLPGYPDSLITGYTQQQLAWCRKNEGLIWNFFLQNTDIYTTEPAFIKDYIGEAPSTIGMPDASPGNIGQWVGWQIVEKYAAKDPNLQPSAIMKVDPKTIFSSAKYKPR